MEREMNALALPTRILFGAWMLASGLNHLILGWWPLPAGHTPLAIQLMNALVNSGLLDVALVIQIVAGALILAGRFTPAALCVLMPISTCALYWSLVLDRHLPTVLLSLAAFALNGLLMLRNLEYYRGALQRRASALGEP
jgi:hypothetical protein